jgi:hypothetical protein
MSTDPKNLSDAMALMLAMPFLMCGVMFVLEGFWIWMLIHCATNEKLLGNEKLVWVLIVLFANWIGALIYCFVQLPKKKVVPPTIQEPPPLIPAQPAMPSEDPDKEVL